MYFRIGSISYIISLLLGFYNTGEQQAILRIPKLAFRPGGGLRLLVQWCRCYAEWLLLYTIAPIMLVLMIYNSANNEKGFIKLIEILIQCATFISLCAI